MFNLQAKLLYFCGFFAFLFVGPLVMYFIHTLKPIVFLPQDNITIFLGGLTSAVGMAFAIWSNYELIAVGKGGAGNFGKVKLMPETKHLVTSGPYAICRNPMHLGVFLYYIGFSCSLNSLITLIVPCSVAIIVYCMSVFIDEPRLKRDFPDEFLVYSSQVPRFLPRIFKRN